MKGRKRKGGRFKEAGSMRRAVVTLGLLLAVSGALCASAQAAQKAVLRVRVVTATNEGKKQPIPAKLRDLTYILKKWRYNKYQLVQDKTYKLAAGAEAVHKVTPKVDRLSVKVRTIEEKLAMLEVTLSRWDEEEEKYKASMKKLVKLLNGRTEAFRDGRIRINDLDTIIFLTYANRIDDDKEKSKRSAGTEAAEQGLSR